MTLYQLSDGSVVDLNPIDVANQENFAREWAAFTGQADAYTSPYAGATPLPSYSNPYQYPDVSAPFQWSPQHPSAPAQSGYSWEYGPQLLGWADQAQQGQLDPYTAQRYAQMRQAALAVPMRDPATLRVARSSDAPGDPGTLDQSSPDWGAIMLTLRDKLAQGTATAPESQLYTEAYAEMQRNTAEATKPDPGGFFGVLGSFLGPSTPFGAALPIFAGALGGAAAFGGFGSGLGAGVAAAEGGGEVAAEAAASSAPSFLGVPVSTLKELGTIGSLAGTGGNLLGSVTGQDWLQKLGLGLGLAGGLTGGAGLLGGGINTVGEALSLGSKALGVGTKVAGLAGAGGGDGGGDDASSGGDAPSRSPGSSSPGGGFMDTSQLGPILAGLIGAAGTGLSLADIARYMGQLKTQYGQQQDIKQLIDQAYQLAATRYETYYAQTQEEQQQKQQDYQEQLGRFRTFYEQTQQEQAQKQVAYGQQQMQQAEDRQRQIQTYTEDRQKALDAYNTKVQQAAEDRDRQINVFGEDRTKAMATYNQRVQEAAQERAMDLQGYQARQAIGGRLADPTQVRAGAEALYQPLSEQARKNISEQVQAEMAQRGVTGGGQYANLMSAKAFAPFEQPLWQNALQAYLGSQQEALQGYANMNLMQTPQYQGTGVPQFIETPGYQYSTVPQFTGTRPGDVPSTVGLPQPVTVPQTVRPPGAPPVPEYTPTPYSPFGTSQATGGGAGGAGGTFGNLASLVSNLTKLLSGGGNALSGLDPSQVAGVQRDLNTLMQTRPDLFGFGNTAGVQQDINTMMTQNPDLFGFGASSGDIDLSNFDPWAGVDTSGISTGDIDLIGF